MSADLNEIKTKIQNLIDLNGQDIDIVGPDLLNDIDEVFDEMEEEINDLKSKVEDLESDVDHTTSNKENASYFIETGRDTIEIWMDKGNLQDVQVIEALEKCYQANVNPLTIMKVLEGLAK